MKSLGGSGEMVRHGGVTAADGLRYAMSLPVAVTISGMESPEVLSQNLLDLLRERLQLTGTKKGCDHGQCGACTVLVDGKRVISCLTLTVTQDGNRITTIEGLAPNAPGPAGDLHPMQTAFIERDGFQCGFCTPGQICSAVAMLDEWHAGMPSAVGLTGAKGPLTDAEVRERMAGNICRCGAYPNIVAAIRDVHRQSSQEAAR